MKLTLTHYTIIVLFVTTGIASFGSYHYSTEYEKQKKANGRQATEIKQLTDTLNYQNTHIDMLHEMDAKRLKVLANAKSEIDTLRADVAAGRRKLHIKAICPVLETVATSSLDDAITPRLEDSAVRDYFTLIERITVMQAQLEGLQDYVNKFINDAYHK
ncbi:lysis protein [Xenorhabdus bovienii]|uniref:lysis protein n=1 Tax=Xenorhabdus bovienii TaxID=40576 RepID=UPI00305FD2E5|nr:lysis protein [Xenorhabdus bovienii]MDE9479218.1 lysis protein [Xenorhabdus bovienii]MDE9532050.1 lysis protein [Xenorhabdus bovienii]